MATSSARARALVELKVIASTGAAALAGVGVTVLNQTVGDEQLLGPLPVWAQTLITMFAPPVGAFLAGWAAKHTARPDLDEPVPAPETAAADQAPAAPAA